MKIRNKILLSLLSMFVLLCGITITTYIASESVDFYRKQSVLQEKKLLALTNLRAQVRNLLLETYEVGFIEELEENKIDLENERLLVEKRFERLSEIMKEKENAHIIVNLYSEYQILNSNLAEVTQLLAKGDLQNAKLTLLDARQKRFNNGFIKKITHFIDTQKLVSEKSSIELETSILHLQKMLISLSALALAMVGILVIFVSKSIGDRLARLEGATRTVSEGNYDIKLPENGSDEVSILSKAFNLMASSLKDSKEILTKQQEIITHTSKMSALGEMAGSIAHEINTPLAAIILNAEMIEMQNLDLPNPSAEITEHSKSIIDTGSRIAKIIMGLKGFSRDASSDEKKPLTVRELIETTVDLCKEKFKNHGVKIIIEDSYIDTIINGQIIQLSQTLLNLLSNSYDATENLAEKWIRLEVVMNEKFVELKVTDSGKGLSPQVVEKMFRPFFTTKDIGKGTGLGLSISKNILKQHDGDLIYDTSASNTCFIMRLLIV